MKIFSLLKAGVLATSLSFTLVNAIVVSQVQAQEQQEQAPPSIEANDTAVYGSETKFTSSELVTNYTYDGTYLGKHINAPLQSTQVLYFEQSPSEVFKWVTSGNADWSLSIETLSWDHSKSEIPGKLAAGSVRRCDFVGGAGTAYERVYAVEENRLFAYDLDSQRSTAPFPIKDFFVIWTVEEKEQGGSLVVARIYYHEAQDTGGKAAAGVAQSLENDFKNFANIYNGTYIKM